VSIKAYDTSSIGATTAAVSVAPAIGIGGAVAISIALAHNEIGNRIRRSNYRPATHDMDNSIGVVVPAEGYPDGLPTPSAACVVRDPRYRRDNVRMLAVFGVGTELHGYFDTADPEACESWPTSDSVRAPRQPAQHHRRSGPTVIGCWPAPTDTSTQSTRRPGSWPKRPPASAAGPAAR
jgi:hypothetical protein